MLAGVQPAVEVRGIGGELDAGHAERVETPGARQLDQAALELG